jgi:aminodeoxyfutalosine deaminase
MVACSSACRASAPACAARAEGKPLRLLGASWVLPILAPPLRDGCVGVFGGLVRYVGSRADAPPGRFEDLGAGVLLPGLVNAHCHLELSHLAGRLSGGRGFVEWIRELVARRSKDAGEVREACRAAIASLAETGTVAVGDVSNSLLHLDLLVEARVRAVVFHELIGWDPARADALLAEARELAAGLPPEALRGVSVRRAAHAPHSVSARLLRALVAEGGPASLHLAESADEARFLADGGGDWPGFLTERGLAGVRFDPPGVSPVAYADALGVLHPSLVAAHCVQANDDDLDRLAARGVHAALCPRSNLALGNGLPPLDRMLARGVRLCLGSDSLASVASLDLLQDVAALHGAFPAVPAEALVTMATLGGALALGQDDLGALEPGRRAALAFAPAPGGPPDDPWLFLASGAARARQVPD